MGWAWLVAHMGERRSMYWVFEGKPAGWRPLVRPKCSQEENIKMGVKEIEWGSWTIHVAQNMAKCGAVVHMVMNLQVL
jgi:hypothetical protein